MKRGWKMWMFCGAAFLSVAVAARADLAYHRQSYEAYLRGLSRMSAEPWSSAAIGAGIGLAIVLISFLPAVGTYSLMRWAGWKPPKWVLALLPASLLVLGLLYPHVGIVGLSVPLVVIAGGVVSMSVVGLFLGQWTGRKEWTVLASLLAAGTILFLSAFGYGSRQFRIAPYTETQWEKQQDKWEREHNEARMRNLEQRRRELEMHGILGGRKCGE